MPIAPWIPLDLITATRLNGMIPVGPFEWWLPASAWTPRRAAQGCGPHARVVIAPTDGEVVALPFGASATELAWVTLALPASLDETAALGLRVYWLTTAGGAGAVRWQSWWGGYGGGDHPTTGIATGPGVTATALDAYALVVSPAGTATPAPALGPDRHLYLQIGRAGADGADTYAGLAYLVGVQMTLTLDDTVDA